MRLLLPDPPRASREHAQKLPASARFSRSLSAGGYGVRPAVEHSLTDPLARLCHLFGGSPFHRDPPVLRNVPFQHKGHTARLGNQQKLHAQHSQFWQPSGALQSQPDFELRHAFLRPEDQVAQPGLDTVPPSLFSLLRPPAGGAQLRRQRETTVARAGDEELRGLHIIVAPISSTKFCGWRGLGWGGGDIHCTILLDTNH